MSAPSKNNEATTSNSKYSPWFRASVILVVEMMERLCYCKLGLPLSRSLSLSPPLPLIMTTTDSINDLVNPLLLGYLNYAHDEAKQIKLAFAGVGYASALLWGYLADRYIGRKAVIMWTVPFCEL